MNGRKAKELRQRWEQQRAKYRRVLDANPLPAEEKARMQQTAEYMIARAIFDEPARPPDWWTPEQIAAFAAVLASDEARSALLNDAIRGWQLLNAEANALPD